MRLRFLALLGATVSSFHLACSEVDLVRNVDISTAVYDNRLELTGNFCTSDPSDLVFPLKVLFVIDTSQSMNINDPIDATILDTTANTGRNRAIRQVITKFIDLGVQVTNTYCNTGTAGCEKGKVGCGPCGAAGLCVGPDCCKAPPCKGVAACPPPTQTNGVCAPTCDVKKPGCTSGEKTCPDCPNPNDQCMNGICGKHLDPGVEFALIRFGSAKQTLTLNPNGVEGFTSDAKELVTALPQITNGGSVTDYEGALTMAFNVLSRDMSEMQRSNAGAVARSKYVVVFLSDGQPDPHINDGDDWDTIPADLQKDLLGPGGDPNVMTEYNVDTRILRRVKEIMGLKAIYHVGDVRFHSAYLAGQNPSWAQEQATFLLKQMADVGKGTFRNFPNGEEINFLHVDFSTLRRVYRLKNFIATNLNAQPADGAVIPDSDGDGLSDKAELNAGTNAASLDTDGDGFSDTLEHFFRSSGWDTLDPKDADCSMAASDANGDGKLDDSDGDGLYDCEERFLGTNKDLFDTDADGIPDGVEVRFGTNPTDPKDVEGDLDVDGMPSGDEIRLHTDPRADDASHRSRASYRYDVQRTGTGIQLQGLTCAKDEDCPKGTCGQGYCRCADDGGCSTVAPCKTDTECQRPGETCKQGACTSKWTCQKVPDVPGEEKACARQAHITCYSFRVENVQLVTPKAGLTETEAGWNNIYLYFGEVPFDNPEDYGNFTMACVRANYQMSTGAKLPATGKVSVPASAWKIPTAFNATTDCLCPDGSTGTCLKR
ncbi:MAG: hypothetical protein IT371_01185 [Deltaproteobacteria bacterium]|nr:hypothetical protein [Deltaproteobacteria bacterium]